MNARQKIASLLWWSVPSGSDEEAKARTEQLLDAYRVEVLAEAKAEVVAWLSKKAREDKTWDAGVLASKIQRGAIRLFLDAERSEADTHTVRHIIERGEES